MMRGYDVLISNALNVRIGGEENGARLRGTENHALVPAVAVAGVFEAVVFAEGEVVEELHLRFRVSKIQYYKMEWTYQAEGLGSSGVGATGWVDAGVMDGCSLCGNAEGGGDVDVSNGCSVELGFLGGMRRHGESEGSRSRHDSGNDREETHGVG